MTPHRKEIAFLSVSEAVRCKFRLKIDELDQVFASWLREVFLAKRRVAVARTKPVNTGV
jgi:hypothetical protein